MLEYSVNTGWNKQKSPCVPSSLHTCVVHVEQRTALGRLTADWQLARRRVSPGYRWPLAAWKPKAGGEQSRLLQNAGTPGRMATPVPWGHLPALRMAGGFVGTEAEAEQRERGRGSGSPWALPGVGLVWGTRSFPVCVGGGDTAGG